MSPSVQGRKRSIQDIKSQVFDKVLDTELSELTRLKRWFHTALKIGVMVGRDSLQNLVKLEAMALAFKTLLSLAPLLAVIFSILKGLGVHNRIEPALAEALAPLGDKGQEITEQLIGFVDKMKAGALGSVGLVTLFFTVLSLMGTIEESFNRIWRVKFARKLSRKFSDYLSALLVGPVLVFAAVTITATLQSNNIVHGLLSLQALGSVILVLLKLLPYLTLWGAFTFVYLFIPNTRVKVQSALVGGFVAAVLWQTVGWAFTAFVASSTQYYVIYSSFAILLLFLLWLHAGWVIVLLGAQVSYAYQHIQFFEGDRQLLAQSPAGREKLALHLMLLIGRNFYHGIDPMSVADLAGHIRVPEGVVKEFMDMFVQTKLVLALAEEDKFVLGRDPEMISVKEILDCVRNAGKKIKIPTERTKEENEVNDLLADLENSAAKSLQGKNLQALILSVMPANERR